MKKYKIKTHLLNEYDKGTLVDVHTRDKLLYEGVPLNWFERVKPKPTVGRWAFFKGHNDTYKYLIRITEVDEQNVYGCGFDGENDRRWLKEQAVCPPESFIGYATDKEVQKALQREAKRRGFVNDKYFKSLDIGRFRFGSHAQSYKSSSKREARVGSSWFYNEARDYLAVTRDYLAVTGWGCPFIVYSCGEWAELGSQSIRINDHRVEPKDGHVKVGCLDVTNQFVEQLDYILQAHHVTLTDAEGKDLKHTIHQIVGELL